MSELTGTPMVKSEGVHKYFGRLEVLKGIDLLSSGQQQRVAIAGALGMGPQMMLFDELTSGIDPELVGEVLAVMR